MAQRFKFRDLWCDALIQFYHS